MANMRSALVKTMKLFTHTTTIVESIKVKIRFKKLASINNLRTSIEITAEISIAKTPRNNDG